MLDFYFAFCFILMGTKMAWHGIRHTRRKRQTLGGNGVLADLGVMGNGVIVAGLDSTHSTAWRSPGFGRGRAINRIQGNPVNERSKDVRPKSQLFPTRQERLRVVYSAVDTNLGLS